MALPIPFLTQRLSLKFQVLDGAGYPFLCKLHCKHERLLIDENACHRIARSAEKLTTTVYVSPCWMPCVIAWIKTESLAWIDSAGSLRNSSRNRWWKSALSSMACGHVCNPVTRGGPLIIAALISTLSDRPHNLLLTAARPLRRTMDVHRGMGQIYQSSR